MVEPPHYKLVKKKKPADKQMKTPSTKNLALVACQICRTIIQYFKVLWLFPLCLLFDGSETWHDHY